MIGGFRYQIDILGRTVATDAGGGRSVAYQPIVTVWAGVDQLSSVAGAIGERGRRLKRIKAWVRNRPEFKLGARIRHQGDDYQITSIESDGDQGRRIFVIAEEALT